LLIFSLVKSEDEVERDEKELLSRFTEITSLAVRNARMYSDIQAANEKLQELDHLKDEFISYAAHELRTPLTAVRGYASLLLRQNPTSGRLTPKQEGYLTRIAISSERVIRLVNNLLDVSRMQAGRFEIIPKPTDLLPLVQEALSEVMPLAQEQKQTLTVTPPPSLLPQVEADRDKIKEVLINILGNAVKFTPAGGSITVSFSIQDKMVITTVKDSGQGVKPEDMQYIFQEYGMVKKNNMQRQEHQGTGLGLYISRNIVSLHGGEMTLTSEGENKGTSVSFSLKIAGPTET
jgi:signal transduction histidine kinase